MASCWRRRCCCCRRRRIDSEAFLTPVASFNASFASLDDIESQAPADDATLCHILRSELLRLSANVIADSPLEAAGTPVLGGWCDACTPRHARCWVRIARHCARPVTTVAIEVNTVEQVPEFPLLRVSEGLAWGALLTAFEFEYFPQWMPMCQAAIVLKRWGPAEQMVKFVFRLPVVRLHLECIVYVCLVDHLDDLGYLEICFTSCGGAPARNLPNAIVPVGVEGGGTSPSSCDKTSYFLGVNTEAGSLRRRLGIRAEVDYASLRLYPTSGCGLRHTVRFVLEGEERCPLDSVICMIWRMLSRSIVPILAKHSAEGHQRKVSPDLLAFYGNLERRILAAGEQAENTTVSKARTQGGLSATAASPALSSATLSTSAGTSTPGESENAAVASSCERRSSL